MHTCSWTLWHREKKKKEKERATYRYTVRGRLFVYDRGQPVCVACDTQRSLYSSQATVQGPVPGDRIACLFPDSYWTLIDSRASLCVSTCVRVCMCVCRTSLPHAQVYIKLTVLQKYIAWKRMQRRSNLQRKKDNLPHLKWYFCSQHYSRELRELMRTIHTQAHIPFSLYFSSLLQFIC